MMTRSRILITGGAVHAKLDAVKIVTNRFKGGRMAELAKELSARGHDVTYLCSKDSVTPMQRMAWRRLGDGDITVIYHDGFIDYMDRVPKLAREHYAAVILGAAVANLVPEPTEWSLNEKFPSHNYQEGDKVMIPFRVAPRVINLVKEAAPRVTLVGFKLLSDVTDTELVRAAYTVVKDAKADLVVANDTKNLDRKLLVTKERSVIEVPGVNGPSKLLALVQFLDEVVRDQHYATVCTPIVVSPEEGDDVREATMRYEQVRHNYMPEIEKYGRVDDLLFGCIAVRLRRGGFLCSVRGKASLAQSAWTFNGTPAHVRRVDHDAHVVYTMGQSKASLNAPLLDRVFEANPDADAIVHTHQTGSEFPMRAYAPPGTVRDTDRKLPQGNFEIENHGIFRLL